ncbi:DUF3304 domain-containing protein [Massilia eburnea]|uniref:DUF3304 domain-containing protein n=1 Tax=Massilia eburnea TaxID=1776165 RepID=UPI003D6B04DC
MKRTFFAILSVAFLFLLASCEERTVGAAVVGFNHTKDKSIYMFAVNGAPGPNVDPESGGGKSMCCISLPAEWRPGMRVKIWWQYSRKNQGDPQPPSKQVELDVPQYGRRVGDIHVHFYDQDQVKVVVSNCQPGHPFYPMDENSLLPWKTKGTKEEYLEWEKRARESHDC